MKYIVLQKLSDSKIFVLLLVTRIVYTWIIGRIIWLIDPSAFEASSRDESIFLFFIATVIFAPILETLIFQVLIIELLRRTKIGNVFIILISSLFFAAAHHDNVYYILATILPGGIYASYYLYNRLSNKDWTVAAIYVFLLHSLYNLIVFVLDRFQQP